MICIFIVEILQLFIKNIPKYFYIIVYTVFKISFSSSFPNGIIYFFSYNSS